ncbi:MAG: 4Fe-4S binding protein [Planctomycetota bacterium]|nr:4Fe-4S binding protein [Planctomycetota bacterium]
MPSTQTKSSLPSAKAHEPRGTPKPSTRTRWRALVLVLVHVAVALHVLHWWKTGSSLSPVEPSEAAETLAHGVVNAGFVLLVLSILATLVVGRFFCGWACHVVAYQDLCASLLAKVGLRPKPIRSRLLALVPVFAAVDIFVLPALATWRGVDPGAWSLTWGTTTESLWETFPGPTMALLTFAVDGFLIVWFFGSKGFCTYGCPYGALFGLADRAAPGRIRVSDACEGCGHCTATCTSNVAVHLEVARHGMVVDPGCMRCMDCVSVCPKGALSFGFGAIPAALPAPKRKRAARSFDFTWPEELLLAGVFAGSVFAFRNLYGAVPFLLAVGLAVITALCAVVSLRLLRGQQLSFQHLTLRRESGVTRAGFACLALMPLVLALAGHSAAVQFEQRQGVRWNQAAASLEPGSDDFKAAASQALVHLGRVERWSLVPTAEVHNRIGQLLARTGDQAGAEAQLQRAIQLAPETVSAHTALGEVQLLGGQHEAAAQSFLAALELRPGEPRAATGMVMLLLRHPESRGTVIARLAAHEEQLAATESERSTGDLRETRVRLAEALLTNLELDEATRLLGLALDGAPDHHAARRCLSALLQREPRHAAAVALATKLQVHDAGR